MAEAQRPRHAESVLHETLLPRGTLRILHRKFRYNMARDTDLRSFHLLHMGIKCFWIPRPDSHKMGISKGKKVL